MNSAQGAINTESFSLHEVTCFSGNLSPMTGLCISGNGVTTMSAEPWRGFTDEIHTRLIIMIAGLFHKYCPLELRTTGRHVETLSALLALCEGNPSEHKWFPLQNLMRPSCLIDGFLCTEVSYAERAFMAVRSHVPCSSSLSSLSANFLRALPFAEVLFMRLVTCSTKVLLS